MADKADIFLTKDGVRIVGSGWSPEVEIEGGNHWNLAESDGDVRIGDDEYMLKMGVATGGGGAGNARIWATSDLKLGSRGQSVVSIDDGGVHPGGEDYSLGSPDNPWNLVDMRFLRVRQRVGSDLIPASSPQVEADSQEGYDLGSVESPWRNLAVEDIETVDIEANGQLSVSGEIYGDGNLTLTGDGGDFTGRAIVQQLFVQEGAFTITPINDNQNLGSEDSPWDSLHVKNIPSLSDRRLKTDIEGLDGGLDAVLALRPVSYRWRDDGTETNLGLIGQEVADVLPEVVDAPDGDDGYLGIDYTDLVAVLVDAIQEQHAENEALEERVDRQRERIENQRERIDDLEARLEALEGAT